MKKILARTLAVAFAATVCTGALAQTRKPNMLVVWGDDIGRDNISAYSMGIMGYRTPNIDRIAKEGAIFTDSYAQQNCTAGRASFLNAGAAGAAEAWVNGYVDSFTQWDYAKKAFDKWSDDVARRFAILRQG